MLRSHRAAPFSPYRDSQTGIRNIWLLVMLVVFFLSAAPALAEAEPSGSLDHLLPAVGSALVEAGQQQWKEAAGDLQQFKELWLAVKLADGQALAEAKAQVDAALTDAESKLQAKDAGAKVSLSTLAKAVNAYVEAASEPPGSENASSGTEAAARLLPLAQESLAAIESKDWAKAKSSYQSIVNGWPKTESPIRSDNFTVYGQLETQISLVRISLQADPVREDQAAREMRKLVTVLTDYTEGKIQNIAAAEDGSHYTLSDLLGVLETARQHTVDGLSGKAADNMNQFIASWPSVEGEVRISSPSLYTEVENQMSEASGYLLSAPPRNREALALIEEMKASLTKVAGSHRYTFWDAALILLREGLEAILVIAALLSYLKRSGNSEGRKYIWSGAGTGFVMSLVLAVVLTYAISQAASGSAREMIEGITGLVAVVMMITVGQWLHNKSNTKAWNQYVGTQVNQALAKGSLWSLFAVALLAILREGAETTIFYVGMASSISMLQLVIGVAVALAILVILGYAIIVLSASLPVRAFFLGATLLIYYLVFRFLGDSIHALQIAGRLSAHSASSLPSVSWLGMYPTWETFIPQLIILAYIIWQVLRQEAGKGTKGRPRISA